MKMKRKRDGGSSDKPLSLHASSLVTVRAGAPPNCEEFTVHEGMISGAEFFRRALQGEWEEAHTRVINMPEDNPAEVGAYLKYIYDKELQTTLSNPAQRSETIAAYMEVGKIYVVAEKVQDTPTKHAMITEVMILARTPREDGCFTTFVGELVALVYERTPESSSMRKLLVDLWSNANEDYVSSQFSTLPGEFLRDLVNVRFEPGKPNVAKQNGCQAYFEKE